MLTLLRTVIRKLPGIVIKAVPLPDPKITSGPGVRREAGAICRENGWERVLFVTDSTILSLGLHEKCLSSLTEAGIAVTVFSDISTEPNLTIVDGGRAALADCRADAIVAFGGGAVMDSCKMIAAGGRLGKRSSRSLLKKILFVRGKTLPILAVPTTAGTGAEITVGAVVTDRKGRKGSTVIVGLDVRAVILDGELTVKTPAAITNACGIDALSHGLEGVVASVRVPKEDMKKSMACVRLVLENLPLLKENPEDTEARQNMCLAAHYGGNAINKQLAGYVHAFAHAIGAKYHIPHGKAIAIALLPVLNVEKDKCETRLAELSRYCGFAGEDASDGDAADKMLIALSDLTAELGFDYEKPLIPKEDYKAIAKAVALDSINYSAPVVLTDKQIYAVLDEINL